MAAQNRWVRDVTPQTGPQDRTDELILPAVKQLEVVYRTDPEIYAAVVPPPLVAGSDPLVHVRVSDLEITAGDIVHKEKIGYFAVEASYQGEHGDYPLIMPLDLEAAVNPSRERFGEPKKLAQVEIDRVGDHVEARVARSGVTIIEIVGDVTGPAEPTPPTHHSEWWIKFSPSVRGEAFDAGPWLVRAHGNQRTHSLENLEGKLALGDLASDPVADLPSRELVSLQWRVYDGDHTVEIAAEIDGEGIKPFMHARYDH